LFYPAWAQLLYSVQTGHVGFEKVYGVPIFEYLSKNPEQARLFDQTMVGVHGRETVPMLEAYDLSGIRVLADIGGGNGSVITAILSRYPEMRGVLFDLPNVVDRAKAGIEAAGLADRCQVIGGDFFQPVIPAADAYLMRHIIHDWDDDKSIRILQNVRRAIAKDGRVLVVESVIPTGNDPSFGKLLDLAMLVLPGGQERTQEEYRKLYASAGLRLTRVVPATAEVCVIEGRLDLS
jgi:ubiquinone/menaquinone biosynthesis C-methylase UbiE